MTLRPGGARDGRGLCRVCAGALARSLATAAASGSPVCDPALFKVPSVGSSVEGQAYVERVREAAPTASPEVQVSAALGLLELGLLEESLKVLAMVDPPAVSELSDRLLGSFLSRLFDPSLLPLERRAELQKRLLG